MAINYKEIEHYSYAKFIDELLRLCQLHNIEIKKIGEKYFEKIGQNYPLYRIEVNPSASKRVCIVAGVQAYEIAGPLSLLQIFQDPHAFFGSQICYRIYPMINPTSFDLRQRMNDCGVDLNNLTKKTLADKRFDEVKVFYKDIKHWKMNMFISLHEDVDAKEFYAYVFEDQEELVFRKIIDRWNDSSGILKDAEIYGDKTDGNGLIINKHDDSFEDFLFMNKITKLAICTETPGLLPLEDRIKMNIENIKIISESLK